MSHGSIHDKIVLVGAICGLVGVCIVFTTQPSAAAVIANGTVTATHSSTTSPRWTARKSHGKVIVVNEGDGSSFIAFSDRRTSSETATYTIASLVGGVLSVREVATWEGGAHPGHIQRLRTINVVTHKRDVPATRFFPESIIVAALLRDNVVRQAVNNAAPKPKTLAALMQQADGGCEVSFDALDVSYAFHHVRDDQVAVRFGLPHGCETMRGRYTEIGVFLPLTPQQREAFADAEARGQLMRARSVRRREP